jgi:hypothetical protein
MILSRNTAILAVIRNRQDGGVTSMEELLE